MRRLRPSRRIKSTSSISAIGLKTADLVVKTPGDQQPLIAIRHPQHCAAQANDACETSRAQALIAQRESEHPGRLWPHAAFDGADQRHGIRHPVRLQDRIGVKEEQPGAPGMARALGKLLTAPALGPDEIRTGCVGDFRRLVGRATICDDNLAHQPVDGCRHQRGKRACQISFLVQAGNYHGDHGPRS